MNAYTVLASFYDKLNASVDYDGICRMIEGIFKENGIGQGATLLDLACGTGALTVRFAKDGYDMIAVDLSEDMLMTARDNSDEKELYPLYLCQDMRELDLYGTVDGGFCCLNSLNYLETEEDLQRVFARLKHFVAPGGIFVFDVNTEHKFRKTYAENTYVYDEEGVYCVWQNYPEESPLAASFELTFFVEGKNGKYTRLEESQRQVWFSPEAIERAYTSACFETVAVYGSPEKSAPAEHDDALYFVIRRQ
ncbi:MAG: class I SAM-dependent methyltransferase [Clostridia bacterium]|nr:class I SAM-dependent methyltransferase [Clostridia bacterium]